MDHDCGSIFRDLPADVSGESSTARSVSDLVYLPRPKWTRFTPVFCSSWSSCCTNQKFLSCSSSSRRLIHSSTFFFILSAIAKFYDVLTPTAFTSLKPSTQRYMLSRQPPNSWHHRIAPLGPHDNIYTATHLCAAGCSGAPGRPLSASGLLQGPTACPIQPGLGCDRSPLYK